MCSIVDSLSARVTISALLDVESKAAKKRYSQVHAPLPTIHSYLTGTTFFTSTILNLSF